MPIIRRLEELPRKTGFQPVSGAILLLFALIFIGGFLFYPSIGIDDDWDWGMGWLLAKRWLQQGRITNALIELILPQPVSPLFPYALLAFSMVTSYALIIGFHGMRHSWKTHLAFLVFAGFPTNWLIQEFVIIVPGIAVGMSAAVLAAFLTRNHNLSSNQVPLPRRIHLPSVLLIVIAIGSYQSMVVLYLCLCLGYCVYPAEEERQSLPLALARKYLPGFLANAIVATIFHQVLYKSILMLSGWQAHQIQQYFRSPYFMLRTQPIAYAWGNIQQVFITYGQPGKYFGGRLFMLPVVIGIALIAYAVYNSQRIDNTPGTEWRKTGLLRGQVESIGTTLMIAILLASPFVMNIVSQPNRLPIRSLSGLPYVAWLMTIVLLDQGVKIGRLKSRLFCPLLVILLVVQLLKVNSSYFGARYFSRRADYLVASSIVSYTTSHPAINSIPQVKMATHGSLKRVLPYSTAAYSAASGSFFGWDHGSTDRMLGYMKMLGLNSFEKVDRQTLSKLKPQFKEMKPWPASSSMQVVDGVLLLKLSE